MGTEHSIEITRAKLNSLFHNIRKLDGGYNLIARKLRFSVSTLDNYLKQGKIYLEEFKGVFPNEFLDLDTEFIDDDFELKKQDIKQEFMLKEDINALGDKYRNAFEVYFYGLREKAREKYIYEEQKEFIESYEFSDISELNERIKLLIQFKLVFDRAQMSIDEEKLYLKSKYSKASSKHLGVIVKDIERRNPEDFGTPEKEKEEKVQQIGVQNNTVFNLVRNLENAQGMLTAQTENKEDIIDVEFESKGE
jgi:hypothetical protein